MSSTADALNPEWVLVTRLILKGLVLPPTSLFVLGAIGWLLRRRWPRAGRAVVVAALLALVALSTPAVSSGLLSSLQVDPPLAVDVSPTGERAIVILSADHDRHGLEYGGATVGPMTLARVRYGARLARRIGLPVLVSGGVIARRTIPLAQMMRRTLVDELGVPVRWSEARSQNTRENARFCADILRDAGIGHVYLVTHAWHMPRARAEFEAEGIAVTAAPTGFCAPPDYHAVTFVPTGQALAQSRLYFHEQLGRLVYRVTR